MLKYIKEIELDVSGGNSYVCVTAKQSDKKTRYIKITLYENGKAFDFPEDVVARLRAEKPDGNSVLNDEMINEDRSITVELTEQILAVSGVVKAEISLYDLDGSVLTSCTFYINVISKAFSEEQIESSYEANALNTALNKADNSISIAQQAANDVEEFLNTADSKISEATNSKLDKQQGIENAGSILKVGSDGNIVLGDVKNHLKTKVVYSFEEFEAFISELYESFSEYAPVWLIFGFNDENNDIYLGSGYLFFNDGSGSFDNALIIPLSSTEIPFTQEIRDEITANKRTRLYPLKAVANLSNQYLTVFNYDDTVQTEIKNISNNTKQVKLIISPTSTYEKVYIGHGKASTINYDIIVDLTNKKSATVDVYFIVNKNGFVNRIIYDCGEDSRVIFPTKRTSVESLYLTAYGDEINFTVSAFGEG